MWLRRKVERLEGYGRTTIVEAPAEYGFRRVAEEYRSNSTNVVIVALEPADSGDASRVSDKLAEACAAAFSGPLFSGTLGYLEQVALLRTNREFLRPLTLILLSADYSVHLATALLSLAGDGVRVIVQFAEVPPDFRIPAGATLVGSNDLRLSREEAIDLAVHEGVPVDVDELLYASEGACERFLTELNRERWRQSQNQFALLPPETGTSPPTLNVDTLIRKLERERRWIQAFELSARSAGKHVTELVARAGDEYCLRGNLHRMWRVLRSLTDDTRRHPETALWYFIAGLTSGQASVVRREFREQLQRNEIPELRALYVLLGWSVTPLRDAELASRRSGNSALALRAHAYAYILSGEPERALSLLEKLKRWVDGSELLGQRIAVASETVLANLVAGRYGIAFQKASLLQRHLAGRSYGGERNTVVTSSSSALAAALTGNREVAWAIIERVTTDGLSLAVPAFLNRISLLAESCLLIDRPEKAQSLIELADGIDGGGLHYLARIRTLLANGNRPAAVRATKGRLLVSNGDAPDLNGAAVHLALANVLSALDPEAALLHLEKAGEGLRENYNAPLLAQVKLLEACLRLREGNLELARDILEEHVRELRGIAMEAWIGMAAPAGLDAEARELWQLSRSKLVLKFLGERTAYLGGEPLNLPLRWAEMLAVLATNPQGLTGEQLVAMIYRDAASISTVKANLSRLRRVIPISSRPYRVLVKTGSDFVDIYSALDAGKVGEAVELYKGPLLPDSDAPAIVEMREHLEETLRQAVIASDDVSVLLALARRLGDDLELWEHVVERMDPHRPEHPLAIAQVKRIERSWDEPQTDQV